MEIRGRLGSGACSLSLVLICFAFLDSGLSVLCGSAVAWLSVSRARLETMGWLARGARRSVPPGE